jgi:hypothetical protein
VTADHQPDPIMPESGTSEVPEAAVGTVPADLPIIEPPTPDPSPPVPGVLPVMPVTDTLTTDAPPTSRRKGIALGAWRIARPMISLGLLALGILLGASAFLAVQPKDPAVLVDSPNTVQPPAAVREFISALAANNPDALRAAVPADPYRLLAGELETRGYQEITSVDTLGTMLDGDRSATEIVIHGSASGGQGLVVNLVVHAQNGVIVSFR